MTNQDQQQKQQPSTPPAAAADVESHPPEDATGADRTAGGGGFDVAGIISRWRRREFVKENGIFVLRGLSLVLSLLAAIIMASNKHGGWKNFDKYEEYRYLLAIAILAALYSGVQVFRCVTGKNVFQRRRTSALVDFIGDQLVAYLLISSSSSAIPLTNSFRQTQDNIFPDASASAISMAFLAFITHALLALISGHRLSSQSYI